MAIDRGAISRTQDTTFVFSDGCRAVRLAVNLRCPRCDAELKAGNVIADRCGSRGAGLQSLRLQRPDGLLVAHGGPTLAPNSSWMARASAGSASSRLVNGSIKMRNIVLRYAAPVQCFWWRCSGDGETPA